MERKEKKREKERRKVNAHSNALSGVLRKLFGKMRRKRNLQNLATTDRLNAQAEEKEKEEECLRDLRMSECI